MDRFDKLELEPNAAHMADVPAPLADQPADGPSHYRAASIMRRAGHFASAVPFYRRAIGFDDRHYEAWRELVDSLVRAGNLDLADALSKEAVEAYKLVRPLYAARALVLGHLGHFEQAFALSNVSIEGDDPSWYAFCVQGELLLREDRALIGRVLARFENAVERAPWNWEAPFLAGLALLNAGLPAQAAGYFAEAAHEDPHAPVCWFYLGEAFSRLRLFDQALFYYDRVVELEPTHETALRRRASVHPRLFGLLGIFRRGTLRKRWRREYERIGLTKR